MAVGYAMRREARRCGFGTVTGVWRSSAVLAGADASKKSMQAGRSVGRQLARVGWRLDGWLPRTRVARRWGSRTATATPGGSLRWFQAAGAEVDGESGRAAGWAVGGARMMFRWHARSLV